MYFCLKMETKNSMGFKLSNIKKKWKLQNGSNNIHLTTFVPASERFRRVHNAFWTRRWLGWPRCMANACIPPASTMAGLLLEQTDRTETKRYYTHYAGTKLYNTAFSNQYRQHTVIQHSRELSSFQKLHILKIFTTTHLSGICWITLIMVPNLLPKNAMPIISEHVLQWNLDFIFLESKFSSTIIHVFCKSCQNFRKNNKFSLNIYLRFLPSSLIICSKKSINWHDDVASSTFNWKCGEGGKLSQFPSTSAVFVVYRIQWS